MTWKFAGDGAGFLERDLVNSGRRQEWSVEGLTVEQEAAEGSAELERKMEPDEMEADETNLYGH